MSPYESSNLFANGPKSYQKNKVTEQLLKGDIENLPKPNTKL